MNQVKPTPMKTNSIIACFLMPFFLFSSCQSSSQEIAEKLPSNTKEPTKEIEILQPNGESIQTRFSPPAGYQRVAHETANFASYLQQLPLKPHGSIVHYYDGGEKTQSGVYAAVVDMEIGKRDLQQCADAVMRLRGEFLFQQKRYDDIRFNFTNGFDMAFAKWRQGYRVKVAGNNVSWVKSKSPSNSYTNFRSYMNMVFAYAGTLSLAKELKSVAISEMQIGDVFIQGGSPGHAVIVVDMAINAAGEKRFMLAQSYMPAQDIQVLQNPDQAAISPWYEMPTGERVATPEWDFSVYDLKRF